MDEDDFPFDRVGESNPDLAPTQAALNLRKNRFRILNFVDGINALNKWELGCKKYIEVYDPTAKRSFVCSPTFAEDLDLQPMTEYEYGAWSGTFEVSLVTDFKAGQHDPEALLLEGKVLKVREKITIRQFKRMILSIRNEPFILHAMPGTKYLKDATVDGKVSLQFDLKRYSLYVCSKATEELLFHKVEGPSFSFKELKMLVAERVIDRYAD